MSICHCTGCKLASSRILVPCCKGMFNRIHFLRLSRRKSLTKGRGTSFQEASKWRTALGRIPRIALHPNSHGALTLLRVLQAGADGLHCFLYLLTDADIELDGSQSVTVQAVQLLNPSITFVLGERGLQSPLAFPPWAGSVGR